MYKLIVQNGKVQYNQDEWVVDTLQDLETIPKERSNMGNTAFVIATAQVFMLNSEGEWVEL